MICKLNPSMIHVCMTLMSRIRILNNHTLKSRFLHSNYDTTYLVAGHTDSCSIYSPCWKHLERWKFSSTLTVSIFGAMT